MMRQGDTCSRVSVRRARRALKRDQVCASHSEAATVILSGKESPR
jgi:hypothetical protein